MPSPEAGATTPAASPARITSRPLSQRRSGLSGMGAPSRRMVSTWSRPVAPRSARDRTAQREALLGAAGADADRVAMGKDPGVEIRREPALVIDVAALAVIARRVAARRAQDLVIGEDAGHAIGALDLLPADGDCGRHRRRSRSGRECGPAAHHRVRPSGDRRRSRCRRCRARCARRCRFGVARPASTARSRSHSSKTSRSTMPT